jgi:hypothetical protein
MTIHKVDKGPIRLAQLRSISILINMLKYM